MSWIDRLAELRAQFSDDVIVFVSDDTMKIAAGNDAVWLSENVKDRKITLGYLAASQTPYISFSHGSELLPLVPKICAAGKAVFIEPLGGVAQPG